MTAHGIDLDSEAIRDFRAKWKTEELSVFGSGYCCMRTMKPSWVKW